MSTDTAASRYDEWYAEYTQPGEEHTLAPWHHQAIPFLPPLQGLRVLEMGAGLGIFARYMAEQGAAEVIASDFAEAAVAWANEHVLTLPNTRGEVGDVQNIDYPDESFDLTVCCSTLEHVVDYDRALAELVRVTRHGGTFLLALPNYLSLTGLYRLGWKLKGKQFREIGQPINHPLLMPVMCWKIKRLGCRITAVDGLHHMLYWPFAEGRHLELEWPEREPWRRVFRWFGLHGLIRAERL